MKQRNSTENTEKGGNFTANQTFLISEGRQSYERNLEFRPFRIPSKLNVYYYCLLQYMLQALILIITRNHFDETVRGESYMTEGVAYVIISVDEIDKHCLNTD